MVLVFIVEFHTLMSSDKYSCKLSHRQIATSLSVSPSIVSKYACKSAELDITYWPLDEKWDDHALQQAFFKTKPRLKGTNGSYL
ncbi:hypothetical protein PNI02_28230 [Pseudoalteromonas nigrifaciens]|jgi:hypothetical protein|nr:hypothetical protein PNI02_28230 [Pseudoalteromonas nigrifaciens]